MAGVSISHAIIFVASMVVAAAVAGVLVTGVGQIGDSIADRSGDTSEMIQTDIEIISDAGASNAIYNSTTDEITVLVKNTGSLDLAADTRQLDVLVNGQYANGISVTSLSGSQSTWETSSVLRVTVTEVGGTPPALSGDVRVTVVVNENEDLLRFRV